MPSGKKLTREEELLLQDFSRNVSTKSSALFYGNAFIISAVPICKLGFTAEKYDIGLQFYRNLIFFIHFKHCIALLN